LPPASECTPLAVGRAMRFLVSGWLCDVAADYASRCVLLAIAMTIIERALLPERPAFFVTAGKRGGGKTTCLHMVSTAALGHRAPAAAWSPQDEERRKALFAYLSEGLPFILWDNLPRGAAISCPSIEKALTSPTYSDRVLQVSQTKTVPAYMVQSFTGNNITARGDMASRSLMCRLEVDRPDPENREFRHPDPIGWTEQHRGKILSALYTILRGNPRRTPGRHSPRPTRFKPWWDLVASAIEFAADQHFLLHAKGWSPIPSHGRRRGSTSPECSSRARPKTSNRAAWRSCSRSFTANGRMAFGRPMSPAMRLAPKTRLSLSAARSNTPAAVESSKSLRRRR
jgi:hypothetical protein